MQEARAILLRRYRFSENSLVVVWLTDTHGKVKTSVRSATKPGSPFAGRLELFTEAEIAFKPSRAGKGGDLHTLSEVVVTGDPALPSTYVTLLSASYFAELCDLFTETMHPMPELYGLLRRAWGFLRSQPSSILKRSWPNCSACRIRRFLRIVPWRPLPINFPRTGSGCWLS